MFYLKGIYFMFIRKRQDLNSRSVKGFVYRFKSGNLTTSMRLYLRQVYTCVNILNIKYTRIMIQIIEI